MKGIFICGTDTGVGKTMITGCLARYLRERGYGVITQKWLQTGYNSKFPSDLELHLRIMGKNVSQIKKYLPYAAPYVFKGAFSPHLASRIENKSINAGKIIKSFKLLSREFDVVIVEGIGGALVPFSKKQLVVDIVKRLGLPVLVVAGNRLGAINHTLMTVEVLRKRNIEIAGIIFNNFKKENIRVLEDNPSIVASLTKEKVFGCLPWVESGHKLYQKFVPIGKEILKELLADG